MSIYGVIALVLVAQIGCSQSSAPPVVGKSKSQSPSLAPDGPHGSRTTKPNPPTKLRLATYNINFGNPNLPAVIDAIQRANRFLFRVTAKAAGRRTFLACTCVPAVIVDGFRGSAFPVIR